MRILGLVDCTHDSGVAILQDGVPEFVIEEERLDRRKHSQRFPSHGLKAAVFDRGLSISDFECLVVPWDVARLRRSFGRAVARRFPLSLALLLQQSRPSQKNGIVSLNQGIVRGFAKNFGIRDLPPIVNVGHHDSHAAIYFASPFDDATVLVADGYGDDAATSAYVGAGGKLERVWHTGIFNSLGLVYAFVSDYLGFGALSGEGKVMALAAFGGPTYVDRFREIVRATDDGRYAVDMSYFSYDSLGMLRPIRSKFVRAFGPARAPGGPLEDRHRDIARALQTVTEEILIHIARGLAARSPSRNLVLTGGVALNCVANARIAEETPFRRVWVPPVASDTGAPLGAAMWHYHQTLGHARGFRLEHPYFGLSYTDDEIETALRAANLPFERLSESDLVERTARDLAQGRIVGWFQGRFEMGPRALGNRSMLADPRNASMRDVLNARVKHREGFRPFAPAILADRAQEYFELDGEDPFMTLAPRVRAGMADRIPAGVHVDGTARLQTVRRDVNPRYYDLIAAFGRLTGVPVLLNTSFNESEPIVATPQHAIACFLRTGMDVLAIGNFHCTRPDLAVADDRPE